MSSRFLLHSRCISCITDEYKPQLSSSTWYQINLDPILPLRSPLMASSPTSSVSGSVHSSNPFAGPSSRPTLITSVSIQHVNIRAHVPIILDFVENNISMWSAFFDATLRKFGVINHVDGSIDAQAMWHDPEWLQVDQGIVSWLYNSVSPQIMKMLFLRKPTAHVLWTSLQGLFLDNADQRAVHALQEFHALFQADLSITD
jgi:hypothetical protein